MTETTGEGLKRVIGIQGLALNIVNCVVGVGIFVLPGIVGDALGAFAVVGYIFCSIMMAAIMLCYAEIGSKVTQSGGSYAYVEAAFGEFPGYLVNWMYFFGWSVLGSAAVINIVADALAGIFPIFTQPFARAIFYLVLIGLIVLVNVCGAKQGIGFIKAVTLIKLLPFAALIILGFRKMQLVNLHWQQVPTVKVFGDAMLILFFAFASFETALGVSGEFKDPKRTVPWGIFLGGLIIFVFYILLQLVTQGILGPDMAMFRQAPLAAVASRIVGPVGTVVILLATAFSGFGGLSADIMATPRSLFACSNAGLFPKFLGRVHSKFKTPYLAVIIYGSLILFFSIAGGFQQLAILATAAILLIYLAVVLATIRLRYKKEKDPEKTFQMPAGMLFPVLAIATIVWLLTNLKLPEVIATAIFIAVVCVIYLVSKNLNKAMPVTKKEGAITELNE